MTGERELLAGELESRGVRPGESGSGLGVKKPTWRTLGSITVREVRRASMESAWISIARGLVLVLGFHICFRVLESECRKIHFGRGNVLFC
jgi:hypothetical protein